MVLSDALHRGPANPALPRRGNAAGSPYRAPELCRGVLVFNELVDAWSLGVLLLEMLGGPIVVPAVLRDDEEALQWVQRGLGCAPERDGEHENWEEATLPFWRPRGHGMCFVAAVSRIKAPRARGGHGARTPGLGQHGAPPQKRSHRGPRAVLACAGPIGPGPPRISSGRSGMGRDGCRA